MYRDTLAPRIDLVSSRRGFGGVASVDDDRTALGDEPDRDLFVHPGSASGDDCNLVVETHGRRSRSYLSVGRRRSR
jgi:hypothetical protein